MANLIVYISAPKEIASHVQDHHAQQLEVLSTKPVAWEDALRLGITEAVTIATLVKSVADLILVALEIRKKLRERKEKKEAETNVLISFVKGNQVLIQADSEPEELELKLRNQTSTM